MAQPNKGKQKGPQQASKADLKAMAEAQTPIEAIGPGVEHEDHEGGITDSLAQKGVRAPLPTAEEKEEAADEAAKDGIIRSPSVRERQTGMSAAIARGGMVQQRRPSDEELADKKFTPPPRGAHATILARDGSREVAVKAIRVGQYPADGRIRVPGEVFLYAMTAEEEKLPSWMEAVSGDLETREAGERSPVADIGPVAILEVSRDGTVATRASTAADVTDARTRATRTTSTGRTR